LTPLNQRNKFNVTRVSWIESFYWII
jgi:hypothetical protein